MPPELTLLTREGCHLCDVMKAVVDRVHRSRPVTVRIVDVATRADLERTYGMVLPVLLHGDEVVARTRVSETDVIRWLDTIAASDS